MWGDFPLPLDPRCGEGDLSLLLDPTFLLLLLGDELSLVTKSKRISGHGWGVLLRSCVHISLTSQPPRARMKRSISQNITLQIPALGVLGQEDDKLTFLGNIGAVNLKLPYRIPQ